MMKKVKEKFLISWDKQKMESWFVKNLWDSAKEILIVKLMEINAYIKK